MRVAPVLTAALLIALAAAAEAQTNAAQPGETSLSGSSSRPVRLTPADVKAALEEQGYAQVEVLQETPTGFTANAVKDGKRVALATDGKGVVVPSR